MGFDDLRQSCDQQSVVGDEMVTESERSGSGGSPEQASQPAPAATQPAVQFQTINFPRQQSAQFQPSATQIQYQGYYPGYGQPFSQPVPYPCRRYPPNPEVGPPVAAMPYEQYNPVFQQQQAAMFLSSHPFGQTYPGQPYPSAGPQRYPLPGPPPQPLAVPYPTAPYPVSPYQSPGPSQYPTPRQSQSPSARPTSLEPPPPAVAPPLPTIYLPPPARPGGRHICPVCSRAFIRPSSLKTHTYHHTGEKPFRCRFCLRDFSTSSNRTRHERKLHSAEFEAREAEMLQASREARMRAGANR